MMGLDKSSSHPRNRALNSSALEEMEPHKRETAPSINRVTRYCKRSVLIACLLLISCAATQTRETAQEKGLFWTLRSGTSTVFLLGSIHVAKPDLYPLPRPIEKGFALSDTLVVEAETEKSKPQSNAEMAFIVRSGSYPPHDSLKKALSPKTYALTQHKLKKAGLDIAHFDRFKPWMVVFTLMGVELQRLGFQAEYGIDIHFIKKAQGKKKIVELEGIREQIGYLNAFSAEEQEQFLLYTLADLELFETQIDAMFAAWLRGDANDFDRLMTENFSSRPELASISEKLVAGRNRTMLAKIESFLKQKGTYFVVVGAGHLVGEGGIVNLLKKKGFRVEQQ